MPLSPRNLAIQSLTRLLSSPRVREASLDAADFDGHEGGTLIIHVPRSLGKPIEITLMHGGVHLVIQEVQQVGEVGP